MKAPLIIDCHCHYGPGDGLVGPWDTRADLRDFLRWSAEAGIGRTNLFAAFHSDYSWANAQVGQLVRQHPDRFSGFAFVHPERDGGRVFEMVKKAVQDYNFCGIKVHRHDARITREICEVARAFRIPVLYDPTGEVSTVELVAGEYPEVNFIIPHMGSFADDWRAQTNLIPMLERYRNVFADTSGIRRFDILQKGVRSAGAHKFLFGSDGPWLHPGVELEKVYALKLSLTDENLVLGGNFIRLTSKAWQHPKVQVSNFDRISTFSNADPWLGTADGI